MSFITSQAILWCDTRTATRHCFGALSSRRLLYAIATGLRGTLPKRAWLSQRDMVLYSFVRPDAEWYSHYWDFTDTSSRIIFLKMPMKTACLRPFSCVGVFPVFWVDIGGMMNYSRWVVHIHFIHRWWPLFRLQWLSQQMYGAIQQGLPRLAIWSTHDSNFAPTKCRGQSCTMLYYLANGQLSLHVVDVASCLILCQLLHLLFLWVINLALPPCFNKVLWFTCSMRLMLGMLDPSEVLRKAQSDSHFVLGTDWNKRPLPIPQLYILVGSSLQQVLSSLTSPFQRSNRFDMICSEAKVAKALAHSVQKCRMSCHYLAQDLWLSESVGKLWVGLSYLTLTSRLLRTVFGQAGLFWVGWISSQPMISHFISPVARICHGYGYGTVRRPYGPWILRAGIARWATTKPGQLWQQGPMWPCDEENGHKDQRDIKRRILDMSTVYPLGPRTVLHVFYHDQQHCTGVVPLHPFLVAWHFKGWIYSKHDAQAEEMTFIGPPSALAELLRMAMDRERERERCLLLFTAILQVVIFDNINFTIILRIISQF